MKTYGADVFSYSPYGRQYVTRWNGQNPLASALAGNSPLSSNTSESPLGGTKSGGASNANGGSDGAQMEATPNTRGQVGEGFQVASIPSIGMTYSDLAPTKSGMASFGGGLVGSALAGPIGGALGGFAGGQAAGQSIGRGAGSAIGGLMGSALGPVGTIAGSALGGWLGGQADGPNMGSFTTITDDGSARAAALGNIASTEGGGGYSSGGFNDTTTPADSPSSASDPTGSDAPAGSGWAKGGHVTRDRLTGPNPDGPDDGYGALDHGEFVLRTSAAQKLGPEILDRLNRGKFNREALARALMGK